jgi:hypothetical protein
MEETMLGAEIACSRRAPLAHFSRVLACALAVAVLGACAHAGHTESGPAPVAGRVLVHNYSWHHVTLYLAQRGTVWRIGEVDGLSDVNLPIPRRVLAVLAYLKAGE